MLGEEIKALVKLYIRCDNMEQINIGYIRNIGDVL